MTTLLVFMQYGILLLFAYLRDFLRKVGLEKTRNAHELPKMKDFVSLYSDFESLYTRNFYVRIRDCWNRPVASVPGRIIRLLEWTTPDYGWTFNLTGKYRDVLNFGSYNYLGFAQNQGPCAQDAALQLRQSGVGVCSCRHELGTVKVHQELDAYVAAYLGVEAAMCFAMGFATNSMNISCFVGKRCLILSDELNHASLILGCRLTGAQIRVFKHNNMRDLERKLREAVIYGEPRTKRPFKKILICIEGIYSMEGSIANLPEIVALKTKYNAYLFLDEAHSIGAIGPHGRGVCDFYGVDPRHVDILMGTFTKSFGSVGGYMGGTRKLIDHLRANSQTAAYGAQLSPACARQILTAARQLAGDDDRDDGKARLRRLARNTVYFRAKLKAMGFVVYGHANSPVVPLLMYFMSRITYASRAMLARGLGSVVVGFPATPLTTGRARFCLSASHRLDDLDRALQVMDELGTVLSLRYSKRDQAKLDAIRY